MIVTCWVDECRVYAERFDALGTRLYITKIRDGDDGIYTCKARIADTGEMLEQETKMFLYGNLSFILVTAIFIARQHSNADARGYILSVRPSVCHALRHCIETT